ncbi:MAG: hypothetical protein AAF787_16875 [Chloroflexota bacterium]
MKQTELVWAVRIEQVERSAEAAPPIVDQQRNAALTMEAMLFEGQQ